MNINNLKWLVAAIILFPQISKSVFAQCPTNETDLESNGPFIISSNCTAISGDVLRPANDITIQSGGTLTLTVSTRARIDVNVQINDGGTLIVNGSAGQLSIRNGGSIIVDGPSGFLSATTVRVGNVSNAGSLTINGSVSATNFTLNAGGTLSGSGNITSDNIVDNGGTDTGWTGSGTCTGTCGVLPVELVEFVANYSTHNNSHLYWSTASETNNEGFFIERSEDGLSFSDIGFVEGYGTSNAPHEYNFDDRLFSFSAFYRLRQIDFDGEFEYSDVVFVRHPRDRALTVYPNPVSDRIRIIGPEKIKYAAKLYTSTGLEVWSLPSVLVSQIESALNAQLSGLGPSLYYLKLQSKNESKVMRLVKK